MSRSYADAVTGWSAHLRDGGTTTWARWQAQWRGADAQEPVGRAGEVGPRPSVPDAVHLELVRRFNLQAGEALPGLADLVLATPSPGRGRVDVPLPWAAGPPRFGSPAIDPQDLPDSELVRLAVGVLARLLPGLPPPPPPPDLARWPMPWRRRFRLHGTPGSVAAVRSALLAQGMVETDWRPMHLVLGLPLDTMMGEHWEAATAAGAHLRWTTLWRRAQAVDAVPARIDVVRTAERLALSASAREPVHLVLARDGAELAGSVATVLGARPFDLDRHADPARVDLMRRLNRLTALTHGPGRVRRLAATLDDLLADAAPRSPSPTVPRPVLAWARSHAEARVERLAGEPGRARRAGYAVHGDPGALVPTDPGGGPGDPAGHSAGHPGTIDPRHTCEVAVDAGVRAWRRQERGTR